MIKGKLLALLTVFAAIGLITASGAFTTVEADRTAEANIAGDSSALLGLETSDSALAGSEPNDEITISLTGDNKSSEDASGVNSNAVTLEDDLITITNRGEDTVTVDMTATTTEDAEVVFYAPSSNVATTGNVDDPTTLGDEVSNLPGTLDDTRYVIDSQTNGVELGAGDSVTVGMYVDAPGSGSVFGSDPAVEITAQQESGTAALEDGQ